MEPRGCNRWQSPGKRKPQNPQKQGLGLREDEVERGQRDGTTREEHAEIAG
jgi:hypothetical protein